MTDHARARQAMIDSQLRPNSVTDRALLRAMGTLPRERFVPERWRGLAYLDDEVPMAEGPAPRRMPAPVPIARMIQLAGTGPGDRVLDVGCGTGYAAAVLASIATSVVAVESDAGLAAAARETLAGLGLANVTVRHGPVESAGAPDGPYDVVLLEAAVAGVPPGLFHALADGGRLVALIGTGAAAVAHLFVKSGKNIAGRADFNATLPTLQAHAKTDEFVF